VNNLNLSLYAFHLCQSLDDAPDTQSKDAGLLWDSLRGLAAKIPFPELAQFSEPTDANPEATLDFEAIEIDDRSLTGNLSTFKIHDTYSLDLTLTFTDQQTHFLPEKAAIFQPQALIEVTANLGKFLWLVGESEELSERQLPTVQQWAKQLCQDAQWIAEDQLFNSPLFIFTADTVTILISVAQPGIVDLDRAQENYYDLRNLFWTYQKILVVGKRAKASYQEARQLYSDLEAKVQEFNQVFSQTPEERLQKLDALLQTIPQKLLDYNCKLRDLKAHHTTIDVNLENFKLCLSHILNESEGDRLSHWSNFATQTVPLTLNQIKTYIDYLEPGQILFSDLINSIRATTELDQAKSDRAWQNSEKEQDKQLQVQVGAVGVAITVGTTLATSASISEPVVLPSRDRPSLPPHPMVYTLLWTIVGFFVTWWIATQLIKRYPQQQRSKSGNERSPNPQDPPSIEPGTNPEVNPEPNLEVEQRDRASSSANPGGD
jgi:hypothetical protein